MGKKLDASKLLKTRAAPRPLTADDEEALAATPEEPKRGPGRPRSAPKDKKKGVMFYVPEQLHADFQACAKRVVGSDMTKVLEAYMRQFVAEKMPALEALERASHGHSRKAS